MKLNQKSLRISFISSEEEMHLMHLVSSALIKGKVDDKQLGRSLIYDANKTGPRILFCGTPDVTLTKCDSALFMCTY